MSDKGPRHDPSADLDLPLGRSAEFPQDYDPGVLRAVPRALGRDALGLGASSSSPLPFVGVDLWRAWELSWLTPSGRPAIAVAELAVPASSPNLVESKSLKLYLGSLGRRTMADLHEVAATIAGDLAPIAGAPVEVRVIPPRERAALRIVELAGENLDDLELGGPPAAALDPGLLDGAADPSAVCDAEVVTELFRSRCPITGQPDWASVRIRYRGPTIARPALLAYLLSFREHGGFHEACVEQIFCDLRDRCKTQRLTVQACFTRRGGLDINPWRSDFEEALTTPRPWRS